MNPRILLIEDNQSDIELLRTAFEEAGMEPDLMVFRDGDEAISGIRRMVISSENLPQLVFLDLNLPRASGHEVLAVIRQIPEFDQLPVLVLSTSNHPVDRSRCLAAGASDYLVKPPHFSALLTLIEKVARRWLPEST